MGTLFGTASQVYMQMDTGTSFRNFDWNRNTAGYLMMLPNTFLYKWMLLGRPFLKTSPVGRGVMFVRDGVDAQTHFALSGRKILRPVVANPKNVWRYVDGDPSKPFLSLQGHVKMAVYITGGVMGLNAATADLQGADRWNLVLQQGSKIFIYNIVFGSIQTAIGLDRAAAQVVGRTLGFGLTIGTGTLFNPFAGQGLFLADVDEFLEERVGRPVTAETREKILAKVMRGVTESNLVNVFKGYPLRAFDEDGVEGLAHYLQHQATPKKQQTWNRYAASLKDAVEAGEIRRANQKRTVLVMVEGPDLSDPVAFTRDLNHGELDLEFTLRSRQEKAK